MNMLITIGSQSALTFTDWEQEGFRLRDQVEQTEWEIGDWLNRGTRLWDATAFERAKEMFKRDRRNPSLYRETCSAFPPERRDRTIGFDHYVELRKLSAPEADRILDHVRTGAQTVQMTKGEARNAIAAQQGSLDGTDEDPDEEDKAYRDIVQAWNRAPRGVRKLFQEQIEETGLKVIDL